MAQSTIGSDECRPKAEQPDQLSDSKGESNSSIEGQTLQGSGNLNGWKLALVVTGLCLAVFCMALDNTIIATAIPRITDEFRALDDLGWYGSAYLLTTCSFQLLFGKLYSYYSVKWVFLSAIGFFELGSLVCGAAPTSTGLVIGRAIAGIGSAGIFSGAILIIVLSVPMRQRPTYVGILAGMYGVSSVAGPLMGGAFTDRLSWRWCFYINLPLGAVTVLFVVLFFNPPQAPSGSAKNEVSWRQQIAHFDLEGSACFLPAIISLLLALQWGGSRYPWSDGRIIGLSLFLVFSSHCLSSSNSGNKTGRLFLPESWRTEQSGAAPHLPFALGLRSSSSFTMQVPIHLVTRIDHLTSFQIPIWFQAVKDASAVRSGIMNLPMILGLVVMSVLAGGAVSAIGYYTPMIHASSILMSIGAGLLTTFRVSTQSPAWIGYQAIYGIGAGLGVQLPLVAVQTALDEQDIPVGTATLMFSQTLGGSIFVQVAQNVFTNQLVKELRGVGVDAEIVLGVGATELRDNVPAGNLQEVLVAYSKALTDTWYVSVAMAVLSLVPALFIPWKSVKGKKVEAATA